MPKYVIEREIPGAKFLSTEQLKAAAQTSCNVVRELGPEIQWIQSYITDDKVYCIYIAPNEAMVKAHSEKVGLLTNRISEVHAIIDPTTAE